MTTTAEKRIPKKPQPQVPTQSQVIQQVLQSKKTFASMQKGKTLKLKATAQPPDAILTGAASMHAEIMQEIDSAAEDSEVELEDKEDAVLNTKTSTRDPEDWEPKGRKPDTVLQLAFANLAKARAEDSLTASKLAAANKGNDHAQYHLHHVTLLGAGKEDGEGMASQADAEVAKKMGKPAGPATGYFVCIMFYIMYIIGAASTEAEVAVNAVATPV